MAVYDPSAPITPQNHDWDCAEQSTLWAMTAFGRHPSDAWMEQSMLAGGIESTDLGLLVGDGSRLAGWITEQYGEFNFAAHNATQVSFDDVVSVAGRSPVLIGGHRWGPGGHWSGVRSYDPATDTLQLANPASGWMNVDQAMTRQQFDALGAFSMVVVTWIDPAPPVVVEPPAAAAGHVVGPGLLEAMTRRGEVPATSEVFFGGDDGWSQAISNIGRTYIWVPSLGRAFVAEGWGP